ncbi:hypothetical protein [Labilibaculum antarcticum]|nr:hypothetical protein [Labilibaculum antarcticum]
MKATKIFILACLLMIGGQAFSQNGTNPFVNSTHTYTVTPGDAGNTLVWSVLIADGLTAADAGDFDIVTNGNATVDIKWNKANDATIVNYVVQLSEESANGCFTLRQFPVTVQANTFYLAASEDGNECHDEDGNIIALGASLATTVDFTVTIDNATFLLNLTTWEFDLAFGLVGTYSINEVKVGGNIVTAPYNSISIDGGVENVTVSVKVTGNVQTAETVTMTVSNGKAIKGTTVNLDNDSGDRVQALTINALPGTTEITTD